MQSKPPGFKYPVINGFLQIVMYGNDGAAFGIFSGQRYMLIAFSIFALVAIFTIFILGRVKHKLVPLALGLCTAGVCGNLYDRIFNNGDVRDFIDVMYWPGRHWPAFNIADSALCIGVGLMIFATILTEQSVRKHAQQQK